MHLALGSANRDPARWDDPDEWDLNRPPKASLAFGGGAHICLGMHVARAEMITGINALLDRLPNLRLDRTPRHRSSSASTIAVPRPFPSSSDRTLRMDRNAFDGVRVVELAQWVFVPVAGALLADWGADVIHIEPLEGDPYRGLISQGIGAGGNGVNLSMALANRNKRSIALDVRSERGREVLHAAARVGRRLPHQPAARGAANGSVSTMRPYGSGTRGWCSRGVMGTARAGPTRMPRGTTRRRSGRAAVWRTS